MVVIRLQRRGTKKTPAHRIVVTDRTRSQRGRILEILGHYNPSFDPPQLDLDQSRMSFWVSTGAQVSDAVTQLAKRVKRTAAGPAAKKS